MFPGRHHTASLTCLSSLRPNLPARAKWRWFTESSWRWEGWPAESLQQHLQRPAEFPATQPDLDHTVTASGPAVLRSQGEQPTLIPSSSMLTLRVPALISRELCQLELPLRQWNLSQYDKHAYISWPYRPERQSMRPLSCASSSVSFVAALTHIPAQSCMLARPWKSCQGSWAVRKRCPMPTLDLPTP